MFTKTGGNALLDVNFILSKAEVGPNKKVADLGCGTSGHFIFPASELVGKRGKVYAVDILKTALETINRRIKQDNIDNMITIWSDLEIFGATKIESGSLDVAMLINTLYQSKKRAEILRESIRLLKKGGRLVVVEWKNVSSPLGPPPDMQVKKDLLLKAGKKLGLEVEDEFEAGKYHFGMIFSKA